MMSIDLIWQNVCANYITVRGPKYIKNFQYFSSVHSYKTNFADIRNYFIQGFLRNYGKKLFVSEWLCSGKKLNRVWKPCHMSHSANSTGIVSYQIMNSFFFAWPFLAISLFVTVFVFFRSVIISCACLLSVVLFVHCFFLRCHSYYVFGPCGTVFDLKKLWGVSTGQLSGFIGVLVASYF